MKTICFKRFGRLAIAGEWNGGDRCNRTGDRQCNWMRLDAIQHREGRNGRYSNCQHGRAHCRSEWSINIGDNHQIVTFFCVNSPKAAPYIPADTFTIIFYSSDCSLHPTDTATYIAVHDAYILWWTWKYWHHSSLAFPPPFLPHTVDRKDSFSSLFHLSGASPHLMAFWTWFSFFHTLTEIAAHKLMPMQSVYN